MSNILEKKSILPAAGTETLHQRAAAPAHPKPVPILDRLANASEAEQKAFLMALFGNVPELRRRAMD